MSDHALSDDYVLSGGTLQLDVAANVTQELTGSITGSGTVEKTDAGNLVFNGGRTLTSDTTIVIGAGELRFKDFAEAGGAKLSVASGGTLANVSGYAITIPATTEFVVNGTPIFRAYGAVTNSIAAVLQSGDGKFNIYSDGTAGAAWRFCGTQANPCFNKSEGHDKELWFNINNGTTVILAKEANVPVIDYFECPNGTVVFETAFPGQVVGNMCVTKGTIDLAGNDRSVKMLLSRNETGTPVERTVVNSGASDATFTIGTPTTKDRIVNFTFQDGVGDLNLNMNPNTSWPKFNLNNAIFRNASLALSSGALEFDESQRTIATGRTWEEAPFVKGRYLRLSITNCTYAAGHNVQVSDFRLLRSGYEVAWPAGTTVKAENPSWQGVPEYVVDDDLQTFWWPGNFNPLENLPATLIIDAGKEMCFNGYKMAAGSSTAAVPTGWTLDVGTSVDGVIAWERIDDVWANRETYWNRESGQTWLKLTYYDVMYGRLQSYDAGYPYIVFPVTPAQGVTTYKRPLFENPNFALSVASGASMTLNGYLEQIGELSVLGSLDMGGTVMRVGKVSDGATGTIDLKGTGTLELGGETGTSWPHEITGGGTVVLCGGSVGGAGTLTGNYTMEFAGGALSGTANISGELALAGIPKFQWDGMTENGTKTYLTAGSFAAGAEDALAKAVVANLPAKCRSRVTLESGAVVVTVWHPGMAIILR